VAFVDTTVEMAMPMILPRGIVVNTDHIYDEVAGYTNVPLDKIYEFWHGIWTIAPTCCHKPWN
jgi:hypothetical protein